MTALFAANAVFEMLSMVTLQRRAAAGAGGAGSAGGGGLTQR